MNYKALPKIDLHCHLDGSVRPETIYELANQEGIKIPNDLSSLRELLIAPETCQSLDEYLQRFHLPVELMQTKENLERITFELYEDAALENIKYLEVRFGPLLHLKKDLTIKEVLESVLAGMKRAESSYDIKGNIIISVLRTMPKDKVYDLIDVAKHYLNKGVVAIDLAASESAGFCEEFKPYVDYAKGLGFHVTIHAGETGVGQNVFDAITMLGAERIGHGIFIKDHQEAYGLVKQENIVLEVCPTSNVQTKAVSNMNSHPIDQFYKDQLWVTINTDNRTVSDTDMTTEIERTFKTFNLTESDYIILYKNSVKRAFLNDDEKARLLNYL